MPVYNIIIIISWVMFLLVWAIAALNVKRDIRGGYALWWQHYWIIRFISIVLIGFVVWRVTGGTAHPTTSPAIFSIFLFTPPLFVDWMGAACAALGVAFAVIARMYLGRNWSPRPAVKEHHELVISGPYAYVRHPIYTGMILAALGTALTGTVFGLIVFIVACAIFLFRIPREEKIMLNLFPTEYPAYQARTKKLIPFVW